MNKTIKAKLEKQRGKHFTEKQEEFLTLLEENNLDIRKAFELSSYVNFQNAVRPLKNEILEMTELLMVEEGVNSVRKIVEIRDSDETIPNVAAKLDASKTILDRIGLGKKDKLEISTEENSGLFILPLKGSTDDEI
jgi:hypothetical protein